MRFSPTSGPREGDTRYRFMDGDLLYLAGNSHTKATLSKRRHEFFLSSNILLSAFCDLLPHLLHLLEKWLLFTYLLAVLLKQEDKKCFHKARRKKYERKNIWAVANNTKRNLLYYCEHHIKYHKAPYKKVTIRKKNFKHCKNEEIKKYKTHYFWVYILNIMTFTDYYLK